MNRPAQNNDCTANVLEMKNFLNHFLSQGGEWQTWNRFLYGKCPRSNLIVRIINNHLTSNDPLGLKVNFSTSIILTSKIWIKTDEPYTLLLLWCHSMVPSVSPWVSTTLVPDCHYTGTICTLTILPQLPIFSFLLTVTVTCTFAMILLQSANLDFH